MSKPQANRASIDKPHTHQRTNSKGFNRRMSNDEKAKSGAPSNGSPSVADTEALQDDAFQTHQHDRVLFLIMNSIGAGATLVTNNGTSVTGTLENVDPKTFKVVMKTEGGVLSISYDDVVELELENVDLFTNGYSKNSGQFRTDSDITTAKTGGRRQEIERWVPDEVTPATKSLEGMTLEDDADTKWDQFQANEQMFGIKSEFDEHLYTTKINKNDPDYAKKLKEAERLAREIESGVTDNAHLAEERGLKFDDSGFDEEDKYSGVARKPSTAKGDALFASLINKGQDGKILSFGSEEKGKYVPPSHRHKIQNIDPAIISATTSAKKPAAPASTLPPKPSIPAKTAQAPVTASEKKKAFENVKKLNAMNEINSLKEFSQNFKIPAKFPEDLLPIVTKDKHKQEEIVKKADANSAKASPKAPSAVPKASTPKPQAPKPAEQKATAPSNENLPPSNTSSNTATSASTPSTTHPSSKTPISTSATPVLKKADAAKAKLNPKAAAFTPSGFTSPASAVASPHLPRASPRLQQAIGQPGPVPYNRPPKKQMANSFFSHERAPSADKKRKALGDNFNFFKGCYKEFKSSTTTTSTSKFVFEKPFVTPPTWSSQATDEPDRPYKSLFPDLTKMPPVMQPPQMAPYQPMPMMQAPQMFYGAPQFPGGMRMSPQQHQPQPVLSPTDGNFQRMPSMYMQPTMPMNPGPMQYQRYAGYPPPGPGAGPIPGMMPQGRMQNGYKNH